MERVSPQGARGTLEFPGAEPVRVAEGSRPILFVVIDTEEEFDWNAPFSRERTSVRHLRHVERIQTRFDRYGIRPTYVIDFPVASQPDGYLPLKEIVDSKRGSVGAHLHRWVTPLYTETLGGPNSFACNLGVELERAKLETLSAVITDNFDTSPRVYKAGRYGIGTSTIPTLERLGFDVDQSVMPRFDFSSEGGPSFRAFGVDPFWFDERHRLLELPCTCAYVGVAGLAAPMIHEFAGSPSVRWTHLGGIVSRLRIADRLVLSPEGFSADEMRRLTASLLGRGCRMFTLTFHSPSIEAGHTPYVRSEADLDQFLARLDEYFDYFFGTVSGTTLTPGELVASALVGSGHAAASLQTQGLTT